MMQGQQIQARAIQWYACRMRRPQNPNRRTTAVGVEVEAYRNRAGRMCKRPVPGTGKRVYVPELILRRNGFDVFMPLRHEWRRKNRCTREKHLVSFPLLNDWLFVGWPSDRPRWHELMSLDVVAGVLGTGGRPLAISDAKVVKLMRRWGGGNVSPESQRYMRTHSEFEVGDTVRVATGSWEGFETQIVELNGPSAKAILTLFGRETPVELLADTLEFVDRPAKKNPQNV